MDFSQTPQLQGGNPLALLSQLKTPGNQTNDATQQFLAAMAQWKKQHQLEAMQQQLMQQASPQSVAGYNPSQGSMYG